MEQCLIPWSQKLRNKDVPKDFRDQKNVSIVLKLKHFTKLKKKKKSYFRRECEKYPYECFMEIAIDL